MRLFTESEEMKFILRSSPSAGRRAEEEDKGKKKKKMKMEKEKKRKKEKKSKKKRGKGKKEGNAVERREDDEAFWQ